MVLFGVVLHGSICEASRFCSKYGFTLFQNAPVIYVKRARHVSYSTYLNTFYTWIIRPHTPLRVSQ
jgi:hypothetical protein